MTARARRRRHWPSIHSRPWHPTTRRSPACVSSCSPTPRRPSVTATKRCSSSPPPARRASASRSRAACSITPAAARASTRWRCSCGRPTSTRRISRARCVAPACRATSRAAPAAPIPRAARSSRCSRAVPSRCRRNGSLSTCRSRRCRISTPPARRRSGTLWIAPRDEALGPAAAPVAPPPSARSSRCSPPPPPVQPAATDETIDIGDEPQVDGTLRTPWKWEEYLVEAAVIGGRDRWARRLRGLEAELRLRRHGVATTDPDSATVSAIDRDLEQLGNLQRFALPVIAALSAWPVSAQWGAWLDALSALAPRVLRAPERVMQVLAEMRPMSEVGPVGIDEVFAVVAPRLRELELDPPPRRFGRLFVGTPGAGARPQLRGRVRAGPRRAAVPAASARGPAAARRVAPRVDPGARDA